MTEQERYMERYHQYKAEAEEYRQLIQKCYDEGKDGKAMYGRALERAEDMARNAYDLATDRGY